MSLAEQQEKNDIILRQSFPEWSSNIVTGI